MIKVPKKLIEQILAYLWSRPMNEAFDMFNQLSVIVKESAGQDDTKPPTAAQTGSYLHRDQIGSQ